MMGRAKFNPCFSRDTIVKLAEGDTLRTKTLRSSNCCSLFMRVRHDDVRPFCCFSHYQLVVVGSDENP